MKLPTNVQVTVAFEEVERMLHGIVLKAVNKYNLDHGETLSAAFYGFLQAFDSYTPDKGGFNNWVWSKASNRILDLLRTRHREKNRKQTTEINLDEICSEEDPRRFDLDDWLGKLNKDAKYVASLVFKVPTDIKATLAQLRVESPANWRLAIREFLKDSGWNDERVKKAFKQIKEKL